MSRSRTACRRCGMVVYNPARHEGKGPCRAAQARRRMEAGGLTAIHGPVNVHLRAVLEKLKIRHEVMPVIYDAEALRGRWKSSQKNALCVPPWLKILLEAPGSVRAAADFQVRAQRALDMGEEFQQALVTTMALGGQRAVASYLRSEGFYDDSRS